MAFNFFTLAALLIFTSSTASAANGDINGLWLAENEKTAIEIAPCEASLCATIIWLKKPRKDSNNKIQALRKRDLVGVEVTNDMVPAGTNKWTGTVYSAKRGTFYKGTVKLLDDKISIKACLTAAAAICKTVKYKKITKKPTS